MNTPSLKINGTTGLWQTVSKTYLLGKLSSFMLTPFSFDFSWCNKFYVMENSKCLQTWIIVYLCRWGQPVSWLFCKLYHTRWRTSKSLKVAVYLFRLTCNSKTHVFWHERFPMEGMDLSYDILSYQYSPNPSLSHCCLCHGWPHVQVHWLKI